MPRRESLGLDASNADHIDESRTRLIIIGAMVDEWTRLFNKEVSRVMSVRRKKPRLFASMASNRPEIWDNDKVKGRIIHTEEDLLIPSPAPFQINAVLIITIECRRKWHCQVGLGSDKDACHKS